MLEWGYYSYVAPTFNPLTHKTTGIIIDGDHATQGIVLFTAAEITDIAKQDAYNILIATDADMTRTDEDMADSLLAAGITLLPEIPTKLANKKAARSAYLSL